MSNEALLQKEVNAGCLKALKRYMATDEAGADKLLAYELAAYIVQCGKRGLSAEQAAAKLGLFWLKLVKQT